MKLHASVQLLCVIEQKIFCYRASILYINYLGKIVIQDFKEINTNKNKEKQEEQSSWYSKEKLHLLEKLITNNYGYLL